MSDLSRLFDLHGRVALVTGGAGLLGCEFCGTLAEAGAQVAVADIDECAAAKVADMLRGKNHGALSIHVDVTDPVSVNRMVRSTLDSLGRLDILVNSAGLDPKFDPENLQADSTKGVEGAFEDYPLKAWQQAIDVNLTGTFLCCQQAVKPMLSQKGGVIINLASIYGLTAPDQRLYQRPGQPDRFKPAYYSATKAGVLGLTRYLAAYYAGKNIRVNSISPGGVYNGHDEEFVKAYSARAVLSRMAEKDEMNGALLYLASDASKYVTGANIVVDGGWTIW